jgi:hypothetical protein
MRPEQQRQVAELMGWSEADLKLYFQAALNLVPVHPATSATLDPFYVKCIDTLTKSNGGYKPLMRMPDDEYKTIVEVDTVAEASLAMFGETGVRWTSALLLDNDIRPPNLKILSETCVNKVVIEQVIEQGSANHAEDQERLAATGIVVTTADGSRKFVRLSPGGSIAIASGSFGTAAVLQVSSYVTHSLEPF